MEKQVTRDYFAEEINTGQKIDNEKVKIFKSQYKDVLKKRTIPMIKQWIDVEKNKLYRKSLGIEGNLF